MESRRQPILRTPIILLALCDLVLLAMRIWPWQQAMSIGSGTTAVDPVIALVAYVGLGFWIGTARQESSRKSLFSAALLGIVAGLFLVAHVVLDSRQAAVDPSGGPNRLQIGLLVCAGLVIGGVGLRTAKAGCTTAVSAVTAIWASMMACLIAVAAQLGEIYLGAGQGQSSDPWKDYQGLAIGTPAMQSLVHSLDTISGFLLIGPIIGVIAGVLFASFAKPRKP